MTGSPGVLLALVFQSAAADSLRLMALRLPESALVIETRARPLAVRDALAEALAQSVRAASPNAREEHLTVAGRLAAAYALAWRDSFLVRQVAQFVTWRPERRATKVWADSMRRAGIAVYGRDGPAAAIVVWRRALTRARAIGDSAGIAALLGNIGAGFLAGGRLDSAESYLEQARALAAGVGDVRVEANAIGAIADVRVERGDLAAARDGYAQALVLRERIGDSRGIAADYNNLGLLAQEAGDLDEAGRQFEAALALNRRDGRDEVAATNLVNLAGLASLEGEFARAAALYQDALATWRARDMWADAAAALHGLGQLEMRRGDYPAARAALAEALAIYERTGPLADALTVRRELAAVLSAAGELQGAMDELRRAQHLGDSARASPDVRAGLALARADLAVQLNALAEAERLYARAEYLYRETGNPAGEAEAQQGRGLLLLARENHPRAQAVLEAALRTQLGSGNRRAAALTRLALGQVARDRGDTIGARRQIGRVVVELERLGDPVGTAAALGERAALEAELGLVAAAESLYRQALEELGERAAPDVAWRLHAGLALTRRTQGAAEDAVRALRAALTELERPTRSLALPERRSGFLADKWEVYAQLALTERALNRPGTAFEASERMRAREMLELLARGRVAAPDTAGELVVREQDLRRRIAELMNEAEQGPARGEAVRGTTAAVGRVTHEALRRAREGYAELLLEIHERAPHHASLVSGETASWRAVAQRLATDQALVEYLLSDSGALAFVVRRDTIAAVDLGVGRRDVARLVEFARGALDLTPPLPLRDAERGRERGAAGAADSLWRAPLRRLHQQLITPLEEAGVLTGATRLVLVPHAELHYLPFGALLAGDGGGQFLVERYDIALTPSASVWLALGERASRAGTGLLALGPRPDALPASRREVAAVARLAGIDGRVLTGGAATEDAFWREAPRRRVVHLASYGVLNKHNPLFSFVDLAPGDGHDGRLEVHEVFGLSLAADLVVLSACQTGLGSGALADVPAGDDWVGLTRAFLHAGARNVVATLWPVDDWATAALMERFYERYTIDADPARALATAQRALLGAPGTAHPFYWAGFVAVGGATLGWGGRGS